MTRPILFYQSPATVIHNVEAVVEHFKEQGLTRANYLRAALRQPSLLSQTPATVIANVEGVVRHFAVYGATPEDYLGAVLRQPSLFCQSPKTIIANVEDVAQRFGSQGLTLDAYVKAALRQPSLFCQSPATVIGHVNMVAELWRGGRVRIPHVGSGRSGASLRPLFGFLTNKPSYFCLADDNYALRDIHGCITGKASRLTLTRRSIEEDLISALGQRDCSLPVGKELPPPSGGAAESYSRNMLLRALIRAGWVRGTIER